VSTDADPRFQRSRESIITSARELLLHRGPAAVTHALIAEHSGISRATVYRHWPRTDQLLAEAMATVPLPFFTGATSPYRDWLTRELTAIARELDLHDVRAVASTLANGSLWDPEMDVRRAGFAALLSDRLASALVEAEQTGEVSLHEPVGIVAATTIGPLYYRATIEHAASDASLIEHCVNSVGEWRPPQEN
jgi:AcrR family transcriptional regulator